MASRRASHDGVRTSLTMFGDVVEGQVWGCGDCGRRKVDLGGATRTRDSESEESWLSRSQRRLSASEHLKSNASFITSSMTAWLDNTDASRRRRQRDHERASALCYKLRSNALTMVHRTGRPIHLAPPPSRDVARRRIRRHRLLGRAPDRRPYVQLLG